jgi:DsbC/DsbD-like thiol-disulfide interchange protein
MKFINIQRTIQLLSLASLVTFPAVFAASSAPQSAPNIVVTGSLTAKELRRGRSARGLVVMEIPSGFHVHSNRPLEKFLIATQLQIEGAKGVRVSSVIYPRAHMRNLKFSKNRVSVYEGRAEMRFNVTVPASFGADSTELKARLRYQSCNDELCFPPQTREITIPVNIK